MSAIKDISNFSLRGSKEKLMGKNFHISDKDQFSCTFSGNYESVLDSYLDTQLMSGLSKEFSFLDILPISGLDKEESFSESGLPKEESFVDTGQELQLHRSWNLFSTNTQGTQQWYTHKINYSLINTVGNFWGYINMFFPLGNNNPVLPLDLEDNNRKEISFFQEGFFPNWDIIKKTIQCTSLSEIRIPCRNSHLKFILYVILALVGESFDSHSDKDESYIQKIIGIRICPYTKPSIRLWLMDFNQEMFQKLESELSSIWKSLYASKFRYSTRTLIGGSLL